MNEIKQQEISKKMNEEMESIRQHVQKNKLKVIDYIIDTALDVDLTIPEVIKGQFAAKMGNTK